MRPNGEELLRGVQSALATYVLPEVQSAHAQLELVLAQALLGIAAAEWDGAAQRLVEENTALRGLARRGAEVLGAAGAVGPEAAALADELRSLADETDRSVRLSDLSAAYGRLRAALGRFCVLAGRADAPAVREARAAVIAELRQDAESRSLSLLGPRADG